MKEISQSTKIKSIKQVLNNGLFLGIVVSLIKNRTIVGSIFNGDISDINILLLDTVLLITGATLGEYLFGRWLKEKFISITKI